MPRGADMVDSENVKSENHKYDTGSQSQSCLEIKPAIVVLQDYTVKAVHIDSRENKQKQADGK
jgi:hypothetical protein